MAVRCHLELPRTLQTIPRQQELTKHASWPKESPTWHAPWSINVEHTQPLFSCNALSVPLSTELRARADKHVATQQRRVHDTVFQWLAAIARRELGPEQQIQIALPADMGDARSGAPFAKGQELRHVGQPFVARDREVSELSRHLATVAAGNRRSRSLKMSPLSCAIWVLLSAMERPVLTHACTMSSLPVLPRAVHIRTPRSHPARRTTNAADCKGKLAKPWILST